VGGRRLDPDARRTRPKHDVHVRTETKAETLTHLTPRAARRALTALVAAPLVAATLLLASPATAAPDAGESAPTDPAGVHVPTAEELAAQRAEAERLAGEVENTQDALAAARSQVQELTEQAEAAMAAEREAQRAKAAAESERSQQQVRLQAATALVESRKGELGRWASQTYRHGGSTSDIAGLLTLIESESTDDLGQRVQMLDLVGRWRGSVVDTVEEAEAVQADATERSARAAKAADDAAADALRARADADAALAAQQGQVALYGALLRKVRADAQGAGEKTEEMARVRAEAEQLRLAARAGTARDNRITGVLGDCEGLPTEGYANGQIPAEALCPVWAAPGHRLRPDAAFAFSSLSQAYAAEFGTPICITDSYRTFESQIAVRAAKPTLAAVPGTSNHGWGTAVDLCGGIQSFGTPQYTWMRQNAPLYGWFHPAWAQQGGTKPEPWHWEYGG
jgi:hypothetical protein